MIALVGNKYDLFENEIVDENEAKKFAESNGLRFYLISAKEHAVVTKLFYDLGKHLLNRGNTSEVTDSFHIKKMHKKKKRDECVC